MIEFSLDARSGVSPYLQVVHQVRRALRLGLLKEGDQLPTVKDVVSRLAINPNTVLKAYRELERDGLVVTRGRNGTVVAASPDESVALDAAADYAARVRGLGLTTERALELVRGVLEASDPGPPRPAN